MKSEKSNSQIEKLPSESFIKNNALADNVSEKQKLETCMSDICAKDMVNYGIGIVESLSSPEFKMIEKVMIMQIMKVLWREIGLVNILKVFWRIRQEEKKIMELDWSKLERKGIARKLIEVTMPQIVMMKVLDDMVGMQKAKEIITELFEKTDEQLVLKGSSVNVFGLPAADSFKVCKDSFNCFSDYTKAQVNVGKGEKFHEAEIVIDTKDALGFDYKFCLAHEIARKYGNPAWCFPWCEIDEVVYSKMGEQLGFRYQRSGALAQGSSKCDFRYERILDAGKPDVSH